MILSKRQFFAVIGYKPHRGQVQIHGALALPGIKTVVAVCGTRFGKTMAAAAEMSYEAVLPREPTDVNPTGDFMGWCVGPDHDKANLVFDACAQHLRKFMRGHVSVNKQDGVIEFTNLGGGRSRIMRRTAADAGGKGKLVGYAVDFMVIDEAAKIAHADIWENQLSTRLVDRGGRSLHISSPKGVYGYFAELYRVGQSKKDPKIVSFKLPSWLNPFLKRKDIEYERQRLPRKVFNQEWGAELLSDSGMVFGEEDLSAIFILPGFEEPREDATYFGGLDLAMTNDHTVLTIVREPMPGENEYRVVKIERFYKTPTQAQIQRIKAIQKRYGDATLNVDESGLGKPIVEQMQNDGMNVRGIVTTGAGNNSKRNQVMNACALVERRRILFPHKDVEGVLAYYDEMKIYQWTRTPSGQLSAAAPEGAHDDCVASFLLTCWWIRASGTEGDGQTHRSTVLEAPAVPAAPGSMVIKGEALAPGEDDHGGVWQPPAGRNRLLWGNSLFGRGRSW